MNESSQPDDLAQLRAAYPDWEIEARWVTSASGPDRRHFLANNDRVTIHAWTLGDLAAELRREGTERS
jgi:hypothetical protein